MSPKVTNTSHDQVTDDDKVERANVGFAFDKPTHEEKAWETLL